VSPDVDLYIHLSYNLVQSIVKRVVTFRADVDQKLLREWREAFGNFFRVAGLGEL
jgi:hypothetical protein